MCHCFNDFSDSFLSLEASFAFNLFSILGGLLGFSSSCLSFFFPPVFSPFPPITMKGNTNQSQLCTSSNSALSFRPEITSFTAWTPSLLTHTHTYILAVQPPLHPLSTHKNLQIKSHTSSFCNRTKVSAHILPIFVLAVDKANTQCVMATSAE